MAEAPPPSASERFRQIFEEIITTQPNTINQAQIDYLVELIINEDSRLFELADQYIQGEQTRIDPRGRIALLTTPEFIQIIWGHISRTLISKLDEDIITIRPALPADYMQLDAREKCIHVRTIFVKLDTIHHNLFPGVLSFISHTLQGLFGSFKDEVNRSRITAQYAEIETLNKITSKIISMVDDKIKRFAGDFVKFNSVRYGKLLPEMCYYNDRCRSRDEPTHRLQFIHKNGDDDDDDDDCWFESLQMKQTPIAQVSTIKSSLLKTKPKLKSDRGGSVRLIRTKLDRTRKSHRRNSTRNRRRSSRRRSSHRR